MNRKTKLFFIGLLGVLVLSSLIQALPAGPVVNYISNSTIISVSTNRSDDAKGTITTINLDSTQQNYKWKAYVGNVTGRLVLDDASSSTIYDWQLSTISGEVYVTRFSNIAWSTIECVEDSTVTSEQDALGFNVLAADNINKTFNNTAHKSFLVGTVPINQDTCKSTATYVSDAPQTVDSNAKFQEILLQDSTNKLVYATSIEDDETGYDGANTFDFQLLIAENESSTVPTVYYFFVELG